MFKISKTGNNLTSSKNQKKPTWSGCNRQVGNKNKWVLRSNQELEVIQEFVDYDTGFKFYWHYNGQQLEGFMQRSSILTFMFAKSHTDYSVQNEFERVNTETSKVGAAQAT